MADDIFPVFDAPLAIAERTTGWAGHLVWLSLAPRIENGELDMTASALVQPYRKLADGTIEVGPERLRKTFALGSLKEARAANDGKGTVYKLGTLTGTLAGGGMLQANKRGNKQ